ncbi:zinc finger domain-containing protein [Streptomyces coelicoflavus]
MTPADASELLTLAAAFDRRTVGEADARAWAAALHAVPLDDDARAAIARHYAETSDWLTPAHVRQQRAKIRAERITAANVVYHGRPGETGAESIAARKALERAVGDGRIPPQNIAQAVGHAEDRPALPPGATRDQREQFAAERLAALGDYMPKTVRDRLADYRPHRAQRERLAAAGLPDPLDVACTWCGADPGQPCRNRNIRPGDDPEQRTRARRAPHPSRLDDARAHHNARQEPAA